jgi:hypothetical protein
MSERRNHVMSVTQSNGMLNEIVALPVGMIVQVGINTMCQQSGIFFLTVQVRAENGLNNSLIRVDTQNKKLLSNVLVPDIMQAIMFDSSKGDLYAWVATQDAAGVLVTIDYMKTGNRLRTLASFKTLTANGGSAVLNLKSRVLLSSLIDGANYQSPTLVTVNLDTGASSVFANQTRYMLGVFNHD